MVEALPEEGRNRLCPGRSYFNNHFGAPGHLTKEWANLGITLDASPSPCGDSDHDYVEGLDQLSLTEPEPRRILAEIVSSLIKEKSC